MNKTNEELLKENTYLFAENTLLLEASGEFKKMVLSSTTNDEVIRKTNEVYKKLILTIAETRKNNLIGY